MTLKISYTGWKLPTSLEQPFRRRRGFNERLTSSLGFILVYRSTKNPRSEPELRPTKCNIKSSTSLSRWTEPRWWDPGPRIRSISLGPGLGPSPGPGPVCFTPQRGPSALLIPKHECGSGRGGKSRKGSGLVGLLGCQGRWVDGVGLR